MTKSLLCDIMLILSNVSSKEFILEDINVFKFTVEELKTEKLWLSRAEDLRSYFDILKPTLRALAPESSCEHGLDRIPDRDGKETLCYTLRIKFQDEDLFACFVIGNGKLHESGFLKDQSSNKLIVQDKRFPCLCIIIVKWLFEKYIIGDQSILMHLVHITYLTDRGMTMIYDRDKLFVR